MRVLAAIACLASALPLRLAVAQETPPAPDAAAPAPPSLPPPATAAAAPAGPVSKVFLGVRAGMYRPSEEDDEDMASVFDDGLDVEGFVAFPLNRFLAIEAAVGYYRAGSGRMTVTDPVAGTASFELDLSVIPITGSLRATYETGPVALTALAGVGLHMASLDMSVDMPGVISGTASDNDSPFGLHVGAGASVAITPRLSLGAEIRRTFVEATLAGDDVTLDGLRIGGTLAFRP